MINDTITFLETKINDLPYIYYIILYYIYEYCCTC